MIYNIITCTPKRRGLLLDCFRIERFHSRGQQPCKFIGTKNSFYIRKEFNSHRIGLGHQHGRRFIVLGHQCGSVGKISVYKHSFCYSNAPTSLTKEPFVSTANKALVGTLITTGDVSYILPIRLRY